MAAAAVSAPRYSSEDFDTASIHSAAPSYVSDAPSYHTIPRTNNEIRLAYTPAPSAATNNSASLNRTIDNGPREQTQNFGLPPVPPLTPKSPMGLYHFRVPTWSASGPTARHYRNVAERRMADGRYSCFGESSKGKTPKESQEVEHMEQIPEISRPLEDPVLVGEVAAAQARRDRIARETGEDILIREDQQWDWLLGQMKSWDERERSWARLHRDVGARPNKRLLGRMGHPRRF